MKHILFYFHYDNTNKLLIITLVISMIIFYFFIKYISSLKKNNQLLKDLLTISPNRFDFDYFCKRNKYLNGFILIISLDNFKKINNFYNYHIGDKIIKQIMIYLKNLNKDDKNNIFRISENEFVIFIKKEKNLNKFLDDLEITTAACNLLKKYTITLSIGVFNKTYPDMEVSFRYANLALNKAREQLGFSKFYADSEFIKAKELENNIKIILKGNLNSLFCLYQPKLDLISNSIEEFEALARISFNNEVISPNIFIPLAEELNLIHRVDYKVAEINISLISQILKQKISVNNIKISFNISMQTLERVDFISTITYFLKKYNIPGKYIEIELTESILSKNYNLLFEKISQLQKLKIDISLDDFTTGFSSAYFLALIPLQKVKLDKSLLDNYNTKKGKLIYINLLNLIKSLEMEIVAEGIETANQLEFLKKNNIKYVQGYLISKPDFINKFIKVN